jgi:hypothetical protein
MATNSSLSVILNEVKLAEAARRKAANLSRSKRVGRGKPVRWIAAPQSSLPGASAVQGVALAANEDVEWSWTHTTNGSYVSGYNIVKRTKPSRVILSAAKNLSRTRKCKR